MLIKIPRATTKQITKNIYIVKETKLNGIQENIYLIQNKAVINEEWNKIHKTYTKQI